MVTKNKQLWIIEVLRLSTNYNGSNSSKYALKYALNFKFPIISKLMVARGNQCYQGKNSDWRLKFLDYQLTIMDPTAQNMP